MMLELVVPLGLNLLAVSAFLVAYWKFRSVTDILTIIDRLQYGKTFSLVFLLTLIYLAFVGARYLLFAKLTQKEQVQTILGNIVPIFNNAISIYYYLQIANILSLPGVKALVLIVALLHIHIIALISKRRVVTLHEDVAYRQIVLAEEKTVLTRKIIFQFIDLLRHLLFTAGFIYFLSTCYDFSFQNVIHMPQKEEAYMRGAFFTVIDILLLVAQQAVAIVVHLLIMLLPSKMTPYLMCVLQILYFAMDIVNVGIYMTTCLNSLTMMFYNLDITQYKDIIARLKSKKWPSGEDIRRAQFKYVMLIDLQNMISVIYHMKEHYLTLKLNYLSVKHLVDFPAPTFEQLYNRSEEDVRADPAPYIAEAICPICMDTLNIVDYPESVCIIRCRHSYHTACLRNWLVRGNPRCPVCNNEVFNGGDQKADYQRLEGEEAENLLINQPVEDFNNEEDPPPANQLMEGDSNSNQEEHEQQYMPNPPADTDQQPTAHIDEQTVSEPKVLEQEVSEVISRPSMSQRSNEDVSDFYIERSGESAYESEETEGMEESSFYSSTSQFTETKDLEEKRSGQDLADLEEKRYQYEYFDNQIGDIDKSKFEYNALNLSPVLPKMFELFKIPVLVEKEKEDYSVDELCQAVQVSSARFVRELRLKQYLHDNPDVWLRLEALKNGADAANENLVELREDN